MSLFDFCPDLLFHVEHTSLFQYEKIFETRSLLPFHVEQKKSLMNESLSSKG